MRKFGLSKMLSVIARTIEPYDKFNFVTSVRKSISGRRSIPEIEKIESAIPIFFQWPNGVMKPQVGLVRSEDGNNAYWPKFARFLEKNDIPYRLIDIKKSTFIEESKDLDIVIWRTPSMYSDQWEATDKIEYLNNYMGKFTIPSKESLWFYEDKMREYWLFKKYNLPAIKTFISHSKEETLTYIDSLEYPIISKDKTSSSAEGVILVKNRKHALKICNLVFSSGMKLYEKYIKQKNYVIFQEFVPNYGYDLRVIIVGNSYFGYYRKPRKNDFRASGSGITIKNDIPIEALILAKKVKNSLPKSYLLAVDLLRDTRDNNFYIIETSIFIGIESSEQLVVNGVAGRYVENNGEFVFEEGRFWLQELMLVEALKDWILVSGNERERRNSR